METIFDHSVTDDEFKNLFPSYKTKADYLLFTNTFIRYIDIYKLYEFRGEDEKARSYLQKTRDSLSF
jgi:hypothetical protein